MVRLLKKKQTWSSKNTENESFMNFRIFSSTSIVTILNCSLLLKEFRKCIKWANNNRQSIQLREHHGKKETKNKHSTQHLLEKYKD